MLKICIAVLEVASGFKTHRMGKIWALDLSWAEIDLFCILSEEMPSTGRAEKGYVHRQIGHIPS